MWETTTLRMWRASSSTDQGRIYIGDEDVTQLMSTRTEHRFVFQNTPSFLT